MLTYASTFYFILFLSFYLFLEREEGREKKRDRNDVREKHLLVDSSMQPIED